MPQRENPPVPFSDTHIESAKQFPVVPEWRSVLVDTNILSMDVDGSAWEKIHTSSAVCTPEFLAIYFRKYRQFKLLNRENPYLYSKNGVEGRDEPVLVALIAPAATGKDTLLDMVTRNYPDDVTRSITTTTRARRTDEAPRAYNFVTVAQFEELAKNNRFVEMIKQGEHYYGTERHETQKALSATGRVAVWRGDIFGVAKMKEYCNTIGVRFICVGVLSGLSYDGMTKRILTKRGSDPQEAWRFSKALYEVEKLADVSDYILVNYPIEDVNGDALEPVEAAASLGNLFLSLVEEAGSH